VLFSAVGQQPKHIIDCQYWQTKHASLLNQFISIHRRSYSTAAVCLFSENSKQNGIQAVHNQLPLAFINWFALYTVSQKMHTPLACRNLTFMNLSWWFLAEMSLRK